MTDVTQILSEIEHGDPAAAERILPLIYDELRKLAAAKLANEKPGQTLQATALVHEAYLRLVDTERVQDWNSRGHFFAAAAEAMRRILLDNARRKQSTKGGGDHVRIELDDHLVTAGRPIDLVALDEAMGKLAKQASPQPTSLSRQTAPSGKLSHNGLGRFSHLSATSCILAIDD